MLGKQVQGAKFHLPSRRFLSDLLGTSKLYSPDRSTLNYCSLLQQQLAAAVEPHSEIRLSCRGLHYYWFQQNLDLAYGALFIGVMVAESFFGYRRIKKQVEQMVGQRERAQKMAKKLQSGRDLLLLPEQTHEGRF